MGWPGLPFLGLLSAASPEKQSEWMCEDSSSDGCRWGRRVLASVAA